VVTPFTSYHGLNLQKVVWKEAVKMGFLFENGPFWRNIRERGGEIRRSCQKVCCFAAIPFYADGRQRGKELVDQVKNGLTLGRNDGIVVSADLV